MDESGETELGRIAGLGHGRLISIGIIVTTKRIIRLDYRAGTVRRWAGMMLGIAGWFLVFISLLTFLFLALREIVVVIGFGTLPIFILLIPRYLGKKTKPIASDIPREQVVRVLFKRPGIGIQRGRFRVNLANGEFFDFWTSGRRKFEKTLSIIQGFSDWSPTIPFAEDSRLD